MTPMMSAIFFEALVDVGHGAHGLATPPRRPCSAWSRAATASWLAWRALSAFCLTVLVISSIDDAVSSSEEACSSVRCDRSRVALADLVGGAAHFRRGGFHLRDEPRHVLGEVIDARTDLHQQSGLALRLDAPGEVTLVGGSHEATHFGDHQADHVHQLVDAVGQREEEVAFSVQRNAAAEIAGRDGRDDSLQFGFGGDFLRAVEPLEHRARRRPYRPSSGS